MRSSGDNVDGGGFLSRIPGWVWAVALIAALLHIAPFWRASLAAPDGWTFTGNLSSSPDYMQYRAWSRQTQVEGPLVSNRFTTTPNDRHLPVFIYWGIGNASRLTGISPEWVYDYLGSILTFAFAILLYAMIRHFMRDRRGAGWVFVLALFGGGLGAYLRFLQEWGWARSNYLIDHVLLEPLVGEAGAVVFEEYRGNYIVQAILDTHFMAFWLISTVAVLSYYFTLRSFSARRLIVTAAIFGLGTLLHVYEGVTLLSIALGVTIVCWARGVSGRTLLTTFFTCCAAVFVALLPLVIAYRGSGLPAPSWRGLTVHAPVIVLAYPAALLLIAIGLRRYWDETGFDGAFLIGWAFGCLALTLSGPFFPYPDRGTMTLQIPLFIIAGTIYFTRWQRMTPVAFIVALVLMAATPVRMFITQIGRTDFSPTEPYKFLSAAETTTLRELDARAGRDDVLLADQDNLRWLAPAYPGVVWAGHFFLASDFDAKQAELARFYLAPPDSQATFLRERGVRFAYIDREHDPARFAQLPGMRLVHEDSFGALFERDTDAR
jgi:hypothetical protein